MIIKILYLFYGVEAQEKGAFLDNDRHLIIKSPHPSPFSVHTGFLVQNLFLDQIIIS